MLAKLKARLDNMTLTASNGLSWVDCSSLCIQERFSHCKALDMTQS